MPLNSLLVPLLTRPRVRQVIKWSVYGALFINLVIYAFDDYHVLRSALPAGASLGQILEAFATTIDTAAWLGLVLLFEIETYLLPESAHRYWSQLVLSPARALCYLLIGVATWGYLTDLVGYSNAEPVAGLSELCAAANGDHSLQVDSISYIAITAENCESLSVADEFFQVPGEVSLLSAATLTHTKRMAGLNLVNAFVWLLIVLLIEAEIRSQLAEKFQSKLLNRVRQASTVFYGVLIAIAAIWLVTGYSIYTWDAALWIAGFWAIELNLVEWEQDSLAASPQTTVGT